MRAFTSLFAFGLLLWLAACAVPTPFPEPLKVGLLLPLEGERRELSYNLLPALFAAAPERVQGRPVEWVILDTHSDPATAAQRARELAADPAVLAVLGPLLPAEAAAAAPVLREARFAWIPLTPTDGDGWLAAWEPACGAENTSAEPCRTVALPADISAYASAVGGEPSPLAWLLWDATGYLFDQLNGASALNRATIYETLEPYPFPPLSEGEQP